MLLARDVGGQHQCCLTSALRKRHAPTSTATRCHSARPTQRNAICEMTHTSSGGRAGKLGCEAHTIYMNRVLEYVPAQVTPHVANRSERLFRNRLCRKDSRRTGRTPYA